MFSLHVRMQIPVLMSEGLAAWTKILAASAVDEFNFIFRSSLTVDSSNSTTGNVAAELIASSVLMLLNVTFDLHWVLGFLLNSLSGVIFVKIFKLFYASLDDGPVMDSTTVQVIIRCNTFGNLCSVRTTLILQYLGCLQVQRNHICNRKLQ